MSRGRKAQHDIDHGQAGADQHDGRVRIDAVQRTDGPRIGNPGGRVAQPGVRRQRRGGRQVAGGQHDGLRLDLAAVQQPQSAARRIEQLHGLTAHDHQTARGVVGAGLGDAFLEIVAEQGAGHEGGAEIAAGLGDSVGYAPAPTLQPFAEPGRQSGLHPRGGHVEQVLGRTGAVGQPSAQATAGFDQEDGAVRPGLGQLQRQQRAAQAPADDGHAVVPHLHAPTPRFSTVFSGARRRCVAR